MGNEGTSSGPAAASPLVRELVAIWSQILDHAEVRDDCSFVALGGDSIAATLCINQIEKRFGQRLVLAELLGEDLTVARLAERLAAAGVGEVPQ
jgi:acyl carrier protein